MNLRLLHLQIKPGRTDELPGFYENRVLPALEETPGCLFAALLHQSMHADEFLSLTVWESAEAAANYADGPVFTRLLRESASFLQETAEWKIKLEGDPDRTLDLRGKQPPVDAYRVEAAGDDGLLTSERAPHLFVRMVSLRVAVGKVEEFKQRYTEKIIPALRQVHGCRDVFLVEGTDNEERFLSLTIWEREEDAVRYELSGEYDRLVKRLADLLSEIYQWKLSLGPSGGGRVGGETLDREGYHLVTGRKLEP